MAGSSLCLQHLFSIITTYVIDHNKLALQKLLRADNSGIFLQGSNF